MTKNEYLKYKKIFALRKWQVIDKKALLEGFKIVEDYNYSPDKSLCILLKNNYNKEELIWNDSFLSFESLYDDLSLSKKVNDEFFMYFRYTFPDEYKEYEGKV